MIEHALNEIKIKTDDEVLKELLCAIPLQLAPVVFSDVDSDSDLKRCIRNSIGRSIFYHALGYIQNTTFDFNQPELVPGIINSMLCIMTKWNLPVWTLHGNETNTMTVVSIPVIVEAYSKVLIPLMLTRPIRR